MFTSYDPTFNVRSRTFWVRLVWVALFGAFIASMWEMSNPDATDTDAFWRVLAPYMVGGLVGMWLQAIRV